MADLANYAEYCKHNAQEAIARHNDHIETCNRVIESADTGRPIPAGSQEDWRPEMDRLRTELAEQVSENARLAAELTQKNQMVTTMSNRIDDLARQLNGRSSATPNTDLVDRMNRLSAELETERARNRRGKGA
jgi:chromosome segregation ATPase